MKKKIVISLLLSSLVYGEGFNLLDKESGEMVLESKTESCKLTLEAGEKITNTNCIKLTNSKNINILCTPEKTICKTVEEAKSFFEIMKHRQEEDPKLAKIKDLDYYKARKIILKAGYSPKKSSTPPAFGTAKILYEKGYHEVDECGDSSPMLPCRFEFNAPNSKVLIVITHGEDIFVTDAYLE